MDLLRDLLWAPHKSTFVKVCTCGSVYIFRTHASKTELAREWLLLENVVDENLQGHEENDDDEVALLEEGAAFCSADGATPQHDDAPETRRALERGWHESTAAAQSEPHLLMSSWVCFIESMALWSSLRSAPFFLSRLLCLLLCPAQKKFRNMNISQDWTL